MATLLWIVAAAFLLMTTSAEGKPSNDDARKTHEANKRVCGKILLSTPENMELYLRSEYPEDHDTACYLRCLAILTKTYDDETGLNLDTLYEAYGKNFVTREQYEEESKTCLEKRDEVECYCMKAYKPLMCLREQYKKRKEVKETAA